MEDLTKNSKLWIGNDPYLRIALVHEISRRGIPEHKGYNRQRSMEKATAIYFSEGGWYYGGTHAKEGSFSVVERPEIYPGYFIPILPYDELNKSVIWLGSNSPIFEEVSSKLMSLGARWSGQPNKLTSTEITYIGIYLPRGADHYMLEAGVGPRATYEHITQIREGKIIFPHQIPTSRSHTEIKDFADFVRQYPMTPQEAFNPPYMTGIERRHNRELMIGNKSLWLSQANNDSLMKGLDMLHEARGEYARMLGLEILKPTNNNHDLQRVLDPDLDSDRGSAIRARSRHGTIATGSRQVGYEARSVQGKGRIDKGILNQAF